MRNWYETDEAKALREENPEACRNFVTTIDQGWAGPRACIGCGHSEIAHRTNGSLPRGQSPRVADVRETAFKAYPLLMRFATLLAAIDLNAHLNDNQYDSIIRELQDMGSSMTRGAINDIFQEAHDWVKANT